MLPHHLALVDENVIDPFGKPRDLEVGALYHSIFLLGQLRLRINIFVRFYTFLKSIRFHTFSLEGMREEGKCIIPSPGANYKVTVRVEKSKILAEAKRKVDELFREGVKTGVPG